MLEAIEQWSYHKKWWWYLPLVLFYGYLLVRYALDITYQSWLDPVNLIVHEAGHVVFLPFGRFMHFAGGTILQLVIPILCLIYFLRRNELMSMTFPLVWLATNCLDVGVYAADAQEQLLPLIVEGTLHDWHWMLHQLGLLAWDDLIGLLFRISGLGLLLGGILWSGLLLVILARR